MNRSDRKIALGALAIAVLALTGVWLTGNHENAATAGSPSPDARYTRSSRSAGASRPVRYYAAESRKVERFPFDPNTADSTQLLRLGLQPWQVRNIYKYRARGGIYRRKEDFARLYGLTVKQYRELEPYIRISDDYQPAATLVNRQAQQEPSPSEPRYERDTLRYPVKIKEDEHIVLNTADTTQLKKVPGIGTYYAKERTAPKGFQLNSDVISVKVASGETGTFQASDVPIPTDGSGQLVKKSANPEITTGNSAYSLEGAE